MKYTSPSATQSQKAINVKVIQAIIRAPDVPVGQEAVGIGQVVPKNNDDDNQNHVPDWQDPAGAWSDDDLVEISLEVKPAGLPDGVAIVTIYDSISVASPHRPEHIKVYTDRMRQHLLPIDALGIARYEPASTLPSKVYVEGVAAVGQLPYHGNPCTAKIGLEYTVSGKTAKAVLNVTVAQVEITRISPAAFVHGETNRVYYMISPKECVPPPMEVHRCTINVLDKAYRGVYGADIDCGPIAEELVAEWDGKQGGGEYADPRQNPHRIIIQIETNGGAYSWSDEKLVNVLPRAFAGSRFDNTAHIANVAGSLSGPLGYSTLAMNNVSKQQVIDAMPDRWVFYLVCDGAVNNGQLQGFDIEGGGNLLKHTDLPPNLHYKLVFMNACDSATGDVMPKQFADRFGAKIYMGWTGQFQKAWAETFAGYFFERLNPSTAPDGTVQGGRVQSAISAARNDMARVAQGADAWVEMSLRVIPTGADDNIDMKP